MNTDSALSIVPPPALPQGMTSGRLVIPGDTLILPAQPASEGRPARGARCVRLGDVQRVNPSGTLSFVNLHDDREWIVIDPSNYYRVLRKIKARPFVSAEQQQATLAA